MVPKVPTLARPAEIRSQGVLSNRSAMGTDAAYSQLSLAAQLSGLLPGLA
jgi:hypothetical protein